MHAGCTSAAATCKRYELKHNKMLEFSRKAGMRRRLIFSCRIMQLRKNVNKLNTEITRLAHGGY